MITVYKGQIPVESIHRHVNHDNCVVLEIDSSAKYYDSLAITQTQQINLTTSIEILLSANHRTLRSDSEYKTSTKIVITLDGNHWLVETSSSRYTTYVVMWKPVIPELIWPPENKVEGA